MSIKDQIKSAKNQKELQAAANKATSLVLGDECYASGKTQRKWSSALIKAEHAWVLKFTSSVALWRLVRRWREWRQHRRTMKACDESRRRMNTYTREQRDELHRRAMEFINAGRVKPPSNIEDQQRPPSCRKQKMLT